MLFPLSLCVSLFRNNVSDKCSVFYVPTDINRATSLGSVEGKKMIRGPRAKLGLTGIQTAIILIAFVIVASVFAFAVLNMGLLTT